MTRPAKLRRTLRAALVPLLLSLAAHGLLLLALWFWPTPSRSTACVVETTRIALVVFGPHGKARDIERVERIRGPPANRLQSAFV